METIHDRLLHAIHSAQKLLFEKGMQSVFSREYGYLMILHDIASQHKPREITLPNGDYGANCEHCDFSYFYPCPTVQKILTEFPWAI